MSVGSMLFTFNLCTVYGYFDGNKPENMLWYYAFFYGASPLCGMLVFNSILGRFWLGYQDAFHFSRAFSGDDREGEDDLRNRVLLCL